MAESLRESEQNESPVDDASEQDIDILSVFKNIINYFRQHLEQLGLKNISKIEGKNLFETQERDTPNVTETLYSTTKISLDANEEQCSFGKRIVQELKVYPEILKNPLLIVHGVSEIMKDFINIFSRSSVGSRDRKEFLDEKASHALVVSEIACYGGIFLAIKARQSMDMPELLAGPLGGTIGNELFAVSAYILSYILFTQKHSEYSTKQAFADGTRVIINSYPAAIASYIINGFGTTGLTVLGVSSHIAGVLMAMFSTIIYAGVTKTIANHVTESEE